MIMRQTYSKEPVKPILLITKQQSWEWEEAEEIEEVEEDELSDALMTEVPFDGLA